jgi:hypothetical protein
MAAYEKIKRLKFPEEFVSFAIFGYLSFCCFLALRLILECFQGHSFDWHFGVSNKFVLLFVSLL